MKSSLKYLIYYFLVFAVFITNIFFCVKDRFFYTLEDLPEGQFLYSSMSPDNTRSAEVYRIDTPKGSAVRVEVRSFNFSDKENVVSDEKNIYWAVNKSVVTVGWEDNNLVTIDTKILDVSKGETYDSRKITVQK